MSVVRRQFGKPRSVYIHVPFCAQRCGYCNFTLVANRDYLIENYFKALRIEIENAQLSGEFDTLFFGGGTPTHLSAEQLRELFELVLTFVKPAGAFEFSIEANPNDMTDDRWQVLREFGVNRISFGGQSFDSAKLNFLERSHQAQQIVDAVVTAKRFIHSVSVDLMFGVGHESIETWQTDLRRVCALAPNHVSTYGLTVEKGTLFWNRQMHGSTVAVDEETSAQMYELAIDFLVAHGFEHYEISNFACPAGGSDHRCRHNQVYWSGEPYLAFGPGAASFDGAVRRTNHQSVSTYISSTLAGKTAVGLREEIDTELAARERLILGLRQIDGINIVRFEQEYGMSPAELIGQQKLDSMRQQDLIQQTDDRLLLTRAGLLVSDSIWVEML